MFCVLLLMMGWCVPPLVALVYGPGSHRLEMNTYICQEQLTVCPNFFSQLSVHSKGFNISYLA